MSVAVTVKVAVPVAVGVPLTTPALDSVSPAGRLPLLTLKVSEPVPPLAAMVWL